MRDRFQQPVYPPHGGGLVRRLVDADRAAALRELSREWPSWDLTPRQLCDLELLLTGAFSPLDGFMSRDDVEAVCESMRLSSGLLWPVPVTLNVTAAVASRVGPGAMLALRDPEGMMLAALQVHDVWEPDRRAEAAALFGTTSSEHPGVEMLLDRTHPWCVGGVLEGLHLPVHHDFTARRLEPVDVHAEARQLGWSRMAAFVPRALLHRADVEATLRTARDLSAGLLVHAAVGATTPGDAQHYSRLRCYTAALAQYPAGTALLTVSPLARRMAPARDALLEAITSKNFGCTHLILPSEDADARTNSDGGGSAGAGPVEELLRGYEDELGIDVVPLRRMVYEAGRGAYVRADETHAGSHVLRFSPAELRRRLDTGEDIPDWFTFPEVAEELRRMYPPRHARGFTVFFSGLSGSGKSTLANALLVKLLEEGSRRVTLLDGDRVRKHLSSELGFSNEHRMLNVRRVGYVASEVTRSGGVAICALIAPHAAVRQEVRRMVEPLGGFVLVHVATSIEVCEARDRKGLYAKARAGVLPEFTGISGRYEPALDADLTIDTEKQSAAAAVGTIIEYLRTAGYLRRPTERDAATAAHARLGPVEISGTREK